MTKRGKKLLITATLLGLSLCGVLIYQLRTPVATVSGARDFADPALGVLGVGPGDTGPVAGAVALDEVIEDYREWARFPPNSRPLAAAHVDVIEFRTISGGAQNMPVTRGGDVRDSGFSCMLEPHLSVVTEKEVQRVSLSCVTSGTNKRAELKLEQVRLEGQAGERRFTLPAPTLADAGQAGDAVAGDREYSFEFQPRLTDWAEMYVTVNFQITGDESRFTHSLTTHFFSSPVAPARFTGTVRDRAERGSLLVTVDLDVLEAGEYTIESNLFAGSEPVGYARADARLSRGRQSVELEYYGKILRDADQSGPFRVVGLRGTRNTDVIQPELLNAPPADVERFLSIVRDDRPKRQYVPYFSGEYQTAAYERADFTEREYDSPEKRERLASLEALRRAN